MMNRYKQLLTYIRSAVTRNYSEKSINSILDYISTSKQVWADTAAVMFWSPGSFSTRSLKTLPVWDALFCSVLKMDLLQEFYETTLEALKDAKNDRLWFKTNTKVFKGSSLISGNLTSWYVGGSRCAHKCVFFLSCAVREALPGAGRVRETAEDLEATPPVLSGI